MYSNKCDLCVSRPHVCIYRAVTRGLKIYFAICTHNDVVALFDIFPYFSLDDMIIFFTFFLLSVKVVLSTPSELICELFRLTFMFAHKIILNSRWIDLYIYVEEHIYCISCGVSLLRWWQSAGGRALSGLGICWELVETHWFRIRKLCWHSQFSISIQWINVCRSTELSFCLLSDWFIIYLFVYCCYLFLLRGQWNKINLVFLKYYCVSTCNIRFK